MAVAHVLDLVNLVLVMTVNPGFGGQRYIATMEPKIIEVRALADDWGHGIDVEVDGGLDVHTVAGAVARRRQRHRRRECAVPRSRGPRTRA